MLGTPCYLDLSGQEHAVCSSALASSLTLQVFSLSLALSVSSCLFVCFSVNVIRRRTDSPQGVSNLSVLAMDGGILKA